MNKTIFLTVLTMLLFGVPCMDAKITTPSRSLRAQEDIAKNELAIVLFYQFTKGDRHNRQLREQVESLKKDFRAASRSFSEVAFIVIDVDKDELDYVANRYGISKFPTFVLFKNGAPLKENGRMVARTGFLNYSSILDLVQNNFDKDIQRILDRKEDLARDRARRRQIAALNSAYWGYPYWGYGYGYGYPYGGWGWGGYYRPGFGIGFGW
jgi:hypothetical protein